LLRFANSDLLGAGRKVTSLPMAIVVVGIDRVKAVVTLVSMNRMVRHSVSKAALHKVWTHSLVTALIAEEISRVSRESQESAYRVALLHNPGTLRLMSAYLDECSRMIDVSNHFGFDLLRTEQDLFEVDHCLAGAYLAQDWDFPRRNGRNRRAPRRAVRNHHGPGCVQVSWRPADALGYAAFSPNKEWTRKQRKSINAWRDPARTDASSHSSPDLSLRRDRKEAVLRRPYRGSIIPAGRTGTSCLEYRITHS
jgi:hypothetical protein